MTFTKDQLLDVESDTVHLDEFLDGTPHDKILNQNKEDDDKGIELVKFQGEENPQRKSRRLMQKICKTRKQSFK